MGSAIRVNFFRPSYKNYLNDTEQVTDQDTEQVTDQDKLHIAIVEYCAVPKSLKEIMEYFNYKHRPSFIENHIKPLLNSKKLGLTIPEKPNSRNQKYVRK